MQMHRIYTIIRVLFVFFIWATCTLAEDIRFAVIADHRNNFTGLEKALDFIDSQNVDFIIVPGDFDPTDNSYVNYYSVHGYTVGPEHLSNNQEIYFVLGNHDGPPSGEAYFQNNIAPHYPANGPGSAPAGTLFSFDRGDSHFVVTNQYWNYSSGGYTPEQLDWIAQDLAASQKPIKFVIGHEPAFPQFRHVGDSLDIDPQMRDDFWQILSDNNVTAYLCGHTHYIYSDLVDGVYQLDAGEARGDSVDVIIVDVVSTTATAHLFSTNGSVPTPSDEFETIVLYPPDDVPPTLTHITISGPAQFNENTGAQYTCMAYYSDGSSNTVTNSAGWSENSNYASINSNGYLTAASVSSDQPCSLTASYGGMTDTYDVTLINSEASYVLTVNMVGSGSYTANPDSSSYDAGTTVQLTATPDDNWLFSNWNGDLSGEDNPATIIMNSDKTVSVVFVADYDNDGASDNEEQGPEGTDFDYDGNLDNIPDRIQENVVSMHTYDSEEYVTLAFPDTTSIINCRPKPSPSTVNSPPGVEFPYGFFEFTLNGVGSGGNISVFLYLPVGEEVDTYYKYGPTPNDPSGHWYEFLNDGSTGAEIDENLITLHFIDGDRGDDDLVNDGTIVDVGGPSIIAASGSGGGGGGDGGGSGGG
jgi:predicted phosphodiesterase